MDFPFLRFALQHSDWVLLLLLGVFVLSICYSIYWVFQKLIPEYRFGKDYEFAGYIYNAMGIIYSLVFAFVTVLVWQNYNGVSEAVSKEASTMNNMYHLFSAFPTEIEHPGKAGLRSYTTTVIDKEWPLLSKNQFSIEAYQEVLKITRLVNHFQPQNTGQSNAHQRMLTLLGQVEELRRNRIYSAHFALSYPAALGLFISTLDFLCFSCLFEMKSARTHKILILFLGSTITGVVYFLVLFVHPFLGPMAIPPDAFVNLLKIAWAY